MPNTIRPTYEDPQLETVRNEVQGKQGNIPVLLLPVRLETRFMKVVESKASEPDMSLENTLLELVNTGSSLQQDLSQLSVSSKRKAVKSVIKNLKQTEENINQLTGLTTQEKGWLKQQVAMIERSMSSFEVNIQEATLEGLSNQLKEQFTGLRDTTQQLSARPVRISEQVSDLIKTMNQQQQRMLLLNSDRLPYTSPQKKKKRYHFIQQSLNKLLHFYQTAVAQKDTILQVQAGQVDRIKTLHREITLTVPKIPGRLNQIGLTPKNWIDFIEDLIKNYEKQDRQRNSSTRSWEKFFDKILKLVEKQLRKRTLTPPTWQHFIQSFSKMLSTELDHRMVSVNQWVQLFKKSYELVRAQQKKMNSGPTQAWKSFTDSLDLMIKHQLKPAFKQFEDQLLPRLEYAQGVKATSARALFYQSLQVFQQVNEYNAKDTKEQYHRLRTSRRKIKQRIDSLDSMANSLIEGSETQLKQINDLWNNIHTSFEQYQGKVSSFTTKTNSQAFGISTTLQFTNTVSQNAIQGLRENTPERQQFFSSLDLQQSAQFYNQVVPMLNEFDKQVDLELRRGNLNQNRREQLLAQLDTIKTQFDISKRKKIVYSNTAYQQLDSILTTLGEKTGRLDQASPIGSQKFQQPIQEMGNIISSQDKTITDKANPLYETERLRPVVSESTRLKDELWVRIYPDDIAIHTHEEELTELELKAGRRYWITYWAASGEESLERLAWHQLCQQLDPQRAAWVARVLDPTQLTNREHLEKFNTPPSAVLRQAISLLGETSELLTPVQEADTIQTVIGEVNETAVLQKLQTVRTQLAPIQQEQQFLWQRAVRQLRKIQSSLARMQRLTDKLTEQELNTLHPKLQQHLAIYDAFNQLYEVVAGIKVIPTDQFVAQFDAPFDFPEVGLKTKDWEQAPHTYVLPDRFALITMQGNVFTHVKFGRKLENDTLQVGLDPQLFEEEDLYARDAENEFELEPNLRWMTDFDEAVQIGMGIRLPLTPEQAAEGFDKVMVLGIKEGSAANGQQLLEQLLENHHFAPEGMSFLPIGTPTNNTEEAQAEFNSTDRDFDYHYQIERGDPLFTTNASSPTGQSDGKRLADGLGINPEIFQHIADSGQEEINRAMVFNRALWPATLGYYMEETLDNVFTYDNIERSQSFFTRYCTGSGFLPTLRIGTQPYGVLPTTAFSRFRAYGEDLPALSVTEVRTDVPTASTRHKLQRRFNIRLPKLLWFLQNAWENIRLKKVKHLYNVGDQDPQQHFLEMLGLRASSVDYHFRYGANIANRNSSDVGDFSIDFESHELHSPVNFWQLIWPFLTPGVYANTFNFQDELHPSNQALTAFQKKLERSREEQIAKSRIYKTRFFNNHQQLKGQLVSEAEISPAYPLPVVSDSGDNYIGLIPRLNPFELFANNRVADFPSNSLLYLLLRQSMLLVYDEVALDILERENLFSKRYRKQIAKRGHYGIGFNVFTVQYSTRWSYLFESMDFIHAQHGGAAPDQSNFYAYMANDNRQEPLANYVFPSEQNALFDGYSGRGRHQSYISKIKRHHDLLHEIQGYSTGQLDRLLRSHIDLCTYRLDAWTLGIANQRLVEKRFNNPDNQSSARKGIYLGAYGWLEDLRPGGERTEARHVPEGLYKPGGPSIFKDADNQGAIHMPSINHAITAAILRAGYVANQEAEEDLNNKMAVNLSSGRVRRALNLLNGVRNGLEVGAVLGYQLERGMHERYQEAELDQFIQPLRVAFPLQLAVDDSMTTNDTNYISNVINGMSLLNKLQETVDNLDFDRSSSLYDVLTDSNFARCPQWLKDLIFGHNGNNTHLNALLKEIDRIADTFDALGDLALSESVYQIVQGNHVRAGAVLAALSEGKSMPVPQIVATPRGGTIVTHRVLLHFEAIPSQTISDRMGHSEAQLITNRRNALPPGWQDIPFSPRAMVAPSFNNWLGTLIGNPSDIRARVSFRQGDTEQEQEVSVADLQLQAIDLLYLLGSKQESGGSELNSRIAFWVRDTQPEKLPLDIELHIQYQKRSEAWTNTTKTFYEVQPMIQQIFELITEVEAVDARTIQVPADGTLLDDDLGKRDETELRQRIEDASLAFLQLHTSCKALVENGESETYTPGQVSNIRNILLRTATYGKANVVPDAVAEVDSEVGRALFNQLNTCFQQLDKSLQAIDEHRRALAETSNKQERIHLLVEIGKEIFGRNFPILPHYQADNAAQIEEQWMLPHDQGLLRHGDPLIMQEWLQGLGRVRPKMYAVEMAAMLSEAFGQAFPKMRPIQFPFTSQSDPATNDYWLGLPFPESYEAGEDKLSLVFLNTPPDRGSQSIGILLDEWLEILPRKTETSGVAFNYDQPGATAPQTLLLAVNPSDGDHWEWDDLVYTLLDTQKLVKNRAVEPEHLDDSPFAQVLPGVLAEVVPSQFKGSEGDFRRVILDFLDNEPVEAE